MTARKNQKSNILAPHTQSGIYFDFPFGGRQATRYEKPDRYSVPKWQQEAQEILRQLFKKVSDWVHDRQTKIAGFGYAFQFSNTVLRTTTRQFERTLPLSNPMKIN